MRAAKNNQVEPANELVRSHRDVMNLMEFPFFSISKNPVFERRVYDDGKVRIEIEPGHRGIATIWDKDILIYAASLVNQRLDAGIPADQRVSFMAYDFLRSTGRSSGGRAYSDLMDALDRLQSTSIRTNIRLSDGSSLIGMESWIKSGKMKERTMASGRKVLGLVEIELNDWVWAQIAVDRSILSISREYFGISSGVARRVYEVGRKHVGQQSGFTISLPRLAEKVGYLPDDKKGLTYFKGVLCALAEEDDLPGLHIHFAATGDPTCAIIPPATVRTMRRGLKGVKLVYLRRSFDHDRRVEAVSPTIHADETPQSELPLPLTYETRSPARSPTKHAPRVPSPARKPAEEPVDGEVVPMATADMFAELLVALRKPRLS
jgi:hypothetical protein